MQAPTTQSPTPKGNDGSVKNKSTTNTVIIVTVIAAFVIIVAAAILYYRKTRKPANIESPSLPELPREEKEMHGI